MAELTKLEALAVFELIQELKHDKERMNFVLQSQFVVPEIEQAYKIKMGLINRFIQISEEVFKTNDNDCVIITYKND